jgi:hypothetical protein
MKLQIIETEDYILAVEAAFEYKINTLIVANDGSAIAKIVKIKIQHMLAIDVKTNNELAIAYHQVDDWSKIIAYQPKGNAPELDLPLLPEIVVEDDVEKLAESCAKEAEGIDIPYQNGLFYGFIKGHKTATKKYSEDDVIKAVKFFASYIASTNRNVFDKDILLYLNAFKQSKTPKWFVVETELLTRDISDCIGMDGEPNGVPLQEYVLKTTTISNKTYLVGKYLNE